jgi:hypothetical protein
LYSCTKEKSYNKVSQGNYKTSSLNSNIGLLHNAYLDSIYKEIVLSNNYIFDSCAISIMNKVNLLNNEDGYSWTVNNMYNLGSRYEVKNSLENLKNNLLNDSILADFYVSVRNKLDSSDNLLDFEIKIADKYEELLDNSPTSTQEKLVNMYSILISSYEYWDNNYEKWKEINHLMDGPPNGGGNGQETDEERKKREEKERTEKIKEFAVFDMAGGSLGGLPGAVLASGFCALLWD